MGFTPDGDRAAAPGCCSPFGYRFARGFWDVLPHTTKPEQCQVLGQMAATERDGWATSKRTFGHAASHHIITFGRVARPNQRTGRPDTADKFCFIHGGSGAGTDFAVQ